MIMDILLILLILQITIGQQSSSHSKFDYDVHSMKSVGLVNEFAELIPKVYDLDKEMSKRMEALKYIIGHLPFAEQDMLIKSISGTGTTLFDANEYIKNIGFAITGPPGPHAKHIFEDNAKAISDHISASVKRLYKGMGCIKSIVNKYGYDSDVDKEKVEKIYQAMDDIYKAQSIANQCSVMFLQKLQSEMMIRTSSLFSLKLENINIGQPGFVSNDDFVYDHKDNDRIVGIKYAPNSENSIITLFNIYATCQHAYKNVLQRRAIEIQQQIAQLNRCIDKKNPNPFAGNSSMFSQSPNITYNGDGEQIGVNNVTLVRPDQRTTNNYLLNWGFGLGKINTRENDKIQLAYPKYFDSKKMTEIYTAIKDNTDLLLNDLKSVFPDIMNPSMGYKPFANLHSMVNDLIPSLIPPTIPEFPSEYIALKLLYKALIAFEKTIHPMTITTNNILVCKGNNQCQCTTSGSCPTDFLNFDKLKLEIESPPNLCMFTKFDLYVLYLANSFPVLITIAEGPIPGKVFDIYHQGNGLGIQSMSTIQSCFGVFTSGAKNDKDACREPLTDDCGHDLDYQCKKSGLYDYINEQPVTSSPLPYNCTLIDSTGIADYLACLRWIDKHFIANTIAVKPSGFTSYGLKLQSSMIEKPKLNDPHNYKPSETFVITENPPLINYLDYLSQDVVAKKLLFVDNSYLYDPYEYPIISHNGISSETNKEFMSILLSSPNILIKPFLLPLLLIITLI